VVQVCSISVGRSKHFTTLAVYDLSPNDFIFTIAIRRECYPAFVTLLRTSRLAARKTAQFLDKT
jgi:hypothetical protein